MAANGQLPDRDLSSIGDNERLATDAAHFWRLMDSEAHALRHFDLRARDGYRPLSEQKQLYARYLTGGNLAARPGTSNHGWGRAVDLMTLRDRAVLDVIGGKYGWAKRWSDAPGEWWHIVWNPGHVDRTAIRTAGKRIRTKRLRVELRHRYLQLRHAKHGQAHWLRRRIQAIKHALKGR